MSALPYCVCLTRLCVCVCMYVCLQRSGGGGGGFGSSGGGASVRTPYLKVVGIQSEQAGAGRTTTQFTPEEEETFRALARCVCSALLWRMSCE